MSPSPGNLLNRVLLSLALSGLPKICLKIGDPSLSNHGAVCHSHATGNLCNLQHNKPWECSTNTTKPVIKNPNKSRILYLFLVLYPINGMCVGGHSFCRRISCLSGLVHSNCWGRTHAQSITAGPPKIEAFPKPEYPTKVCWFRFTSNTVMIYAFQLGNHVPKILFGYTFNTINFEATKKCRLLDDLWGHFLALTSQKNTCFCWPCFSCNRGKKTWDMPVNLAPKNGLETRVRDLHDMLLDWSLPTTWRIQGGRFEPIVVNGVLVMTPVNDQK